MSFVCVRAHRSLHYFFSPDDSQVVDKKVVIVIAICIVGCSLMALAVGSFILFLQWRRRHRVFAVADGNILSNAIYMFIMFTFDDIHLKKGLTGSCLTLQMRILVLHMLGSSSTIL